MNKYLNEAINKGYAKEYYKSYLIYPKKFMNSFLLNILLKTMENDGYKFYRIMDTIKAIKEG